MALPTEGLALILKAVSRLGGRATIAQLRQTLAGRMPPISVEHLVLHGLKYGLFSRK
jgi:hypothetical protein